MVTRPEMETTSGSTLAGETGAGSDAAGRPGSWDAPQLAKDSPNKALRKRGALIAHVPNL